MYNYLDFDVDENGIIQDPGKFEGCPIWVPYFWEKGLSGYADLDDGIVFGFQVDQEDIDLFPDLEDVNVVALEEDDLGFVHYSTDYTSIADLEQQLSEVYKREYREDEDEEDEEDE
jgi:hypothetical protein